MAKGRLVTANAGSVSLKLDEYLDYRLSAGPGRPIWAFGCIEGSKLDSKGEPRLEYQWSLGPTAPPNPTGPHITPDRPVNALDTYVVNMSFTGISTYRLVVTKEPGNTTIQDISYEYDDPTESYPEPLGVTLI